MLTFSQEDVIDILLALHESLELDRLDCVDLPRGVEGLDHGTRDVLFSLELLIGQWVSLADHGAVPIWL